MQDNKPNIEKLEKLFNIFINDVGEEYFINLQKIYRILQNTLLNKEYVDNLTEEKLDVFIEKNKELLSYFDYFEYFNLRNYAIKRFYETDNDIGIYQSKRMVFISITHFLNNIIFDKFIYSKILNINDRLNDLEGQIDLHKSSNRFSNLLFSNLYFYLFLDTQNINRLELNIEDSNFYEKRFLNFKSYIDLNINIPVAVVIANFLNWYSEDYIEKVTIKNYLCIKNIEINNFNSKEIYLLGENGVGKTILLQSILFALKDSYKVKRLLEDNVFSTKKDVEFDIKCFPNGENITFAYGVSRNNISTTTDVHEYETLFKSNAGLHNIESWLMKLYNIENEEKLKPEKSIPHIKLSIAIEFLKELLDGNVEIIVEAVKVTFKEKGTPLNLNQLSDGYKSVLIWVTDLISRFSETQVWVTDLHNFKGTVLIDELDLFLHPKWAYTIMSKLRTWFPRVRFIISTHSPVLIWGASKDAIFYKVYKNENGETQVSEPVSGISNLMANSVITSPLFGMEKAYSNAFDKEKEELRLGDDFIQDKIYDFVVNKIKNKKNIEEKDIMTLIKEKYNEIY